MRYPAQLSTLLTLAALAWTPLAAGAALSVDTTVDDPALTGCDDATPNDCSLRGAIIRANELAEASTIFVPAGTYSLTAAAACPFQSHQWGGYSFTTVSLCLRSNATLSGEGADATIIDANQLDRVALVSDGYTVEIHGLTLRHGLGASGRATAMTDGGGAIYNGGALTLVDSAVVDSSGGFAGGGIYNDHSLTLRRSWVIGNTAAGSGGGIANESFHDITPLTIQDSTIALNQSATSLGGGIENFGGVVSITGSTINGNAAASVGGGIHNGNNSAAMEIVNSTLSGNTSGSSGGGIDSASANAIVLNNVTITANVGAANQAGSTGGITGGPFSMSNTVVAGNRDARGGTPDCFATVISKGYNLIQAAIPNCTITGDTTGNILGQDPKLGVLADNGGSTFTHALAADSPAVDAGSAAAPATGGSACAITDQRALFRPLGARCDIGAFERSAAFAVANISPPRGGNTGQVTAHVEGNAFVSGASVKLVRSGQPDIAGMNAQVDIGGSALAASFDLNAKQPGAWDVVVTNPDGTSRTLPGAFAIRTGTGPDLWVDVIGLIARHHPSIVTILYGNRGDTDALGVPLSLSLPSGFPWTRFFDITPPPTQPGEARPDWNLVSELVGIPGQPDFLDAPLFLPVVPSGFSGALRLSLSLPTDAADSAMFAAAGDPVVTPQTESAFIDRAVAGTQTFATQGFGVTVPASVATQLRQYATTQLHAIIANGQAAFTASQGTAPQIYSLDQFQMDLFFFIVPRVSPPATSPVRR